MRSRAFRSPNPGTGRPQYSQSRKAARFAPATPSRYRTSRGHLRHPTISDVTRSRGSDDTAVSGCRPVAKGVRRPEETAKSFSGPPSWEERIVVSKSRTVRFSRVVDLSQPIGPKTQMFSAYPPPTFTQWTTREVHGFLAESMFMVTHTGTHVDAPFHFDPGGRKLDDMALERFVAPGHVLDVRGLPAKGSILPRHLQSARRDLPNRLRKGNAVLLRTGWWERHRGTPAYLFENPGVTKAAAEVLADWGVGLVGIDTANIDRPDDAGYPAHHTLLQANVPVIENVANLAALRSSACLLVALPLKLEGASGSPIRLVALAE